MFTLNNLEKVGLLKRTETKTLHNHFKKALNLINEKVDEMNPKDTSYVFSGYFLKLPSKIPLPKFLLVMHRC